MIVIRPQRENDRIRLGLFGDVPNLSAVSAVVEIDNVPRIGAFARKTLEVHMVQDPALSNTREKLGLFLAVHKELHRAILREGYTDAHCWTDNVRFGKLLMHLGWKKALWPCYVLEDTKNG